MTTMMIIILMMKISRRGHRNHELGAEFDDSDIQSDQFNSQATQVVIMMVIAFMVMVVMIKMVMMMIF